MEPERVIPRERRTRALKPFSFGCLKGHYSLNITNGCLHRCVYCYARGYPGAPEANTVELYVNLPELIARELRGRKRPRFVVLNTASDCFQPHPSILELTHRCLKLLLENGLTVHFLTKGRIPPETLDLLSRYPKQVRAQVGLVSLDRAYWKLFEPRTAPPEERLKMIEELAQRGILPDVRIDPMIPFFTDSEDQMKRLLSALRDLGVKRVILNYLHLRPGIEENLKRELGGLWQRISFCYRNQPWQKVGLSTKSKLLPLGLRRRGYDRIRSWAGEMGIEAVLCSCKNPDLPGQTCIRVDPQGWVQMRLF